LPFGGQVKLPGAKDNSRLKTSTLGNEEFRNSGWSFSRLAARPSAVVSLIIARYDENLEPIPDAQAY
jgi:hypothetical protein